MMRELIEQKIFPLDQLARKAAHKFSFKRDIYSTLVRDESKIFKALLGPRGVGKTVLLRQLCSEKKDSVYFSADTLEFAKAFEQHLICNQILVQALVPGMKSADYGRIINIIATSVKQPIDGLGVSNTIRGAVANWSKTLANELGPFGITVNNVLPGFTATDRLADIVANAARKFNKTESEASEFMKSLVPARRFAQPGEIANAVAFLSSEAASYINGINLPVDGGRTKSL